VNERARELRIIFIGDSFVNGYGDSDLLGWTGRVCKTLLKRGFAVTAYNLGVRRDTSADILRRWQPEVLARAAFDPLLVFSWGVNDTAVEDDGRRVEEGESERNLEAMLAAATSQGRTIFIGPPPVADVAHSERIALLTGRLRRVADSRDVRFVPVVDSLLDDPVWQREVVARDGSHPDSAGYERLASVIESDPAWRAWIDG
jgi:lysophospholipase L1-like esterase